MKVIRLHAPFDLRLHDEPVPQIKPDEVLIRIQSVGVCASDLHYYKEGRIGSAVVTEPIVVGHEPSGVIAEVGSAVTGLKKGDRIAIEPAKPCWECEFCKAGDYNVCKGVEFFGTPPIDGTLREFVAWPARLAIPIPDNISFDEAAMVEPLAVGVYAADLAHLKGGETIAVLGAGAIGLSVMQAAKLSKPSNLVITDPIPERRKIAMELGATAAVDPSSCATSRILETNGGKEFDVVFECAGQPEAFKQASELAKPLGHVLIVGIPEEDEYVFPASVTRRKGLTATFVRRSNGTTERSLELVADGHINVATYATHVFPLERTREAFDVAASRKDGVIRATIHVND